MTEIEVAGAIMARGEALAEVADLRAGLAELYADALHLRVRAADWSGRLGRFRVRQGWRALGYSSWRACVVAEFERHLPNATRQLALAFADDAPPAPAAVAAAAVADPEADGPAPAPLRAAPRPAAEVRVQAEADYLARLDFAGRGFGAHSAAVAARDALDWLRAAPALGTLVKAGLADPRGDDGPRRGPWSRRLVALLATPGPESWSPCGACDDGKQDGLDCARCGGSGISTGSRRP